MSESPKPVPAIQIDLERITGPQLVEKIEALVDLAKHTGLALTLKNITFGCNTCGYTLVMPGPMDYKVLKDFRHCPKCGIKQRQAVPASKVKRA